MPNTTEFTMGGLTLQLRLDGLARLNIDAVLDEGIMGLFIKGQGDFKLPPVPKMLLVLQGANKTSGVTAKMIKEAYIKYVDEEGGTDMEIMNVISELVGMNEIEKKEMTDGESGLSLEALME